MATKKPLMDTNHHISVRLHDFGSEMRSRSASLGTVSRYMNRHRARLAPPAVATHTVGGATLTPSCSSSRSPQKNISSCGSLNKSPILPRRRGSLQINSSGTWITPRRGSISTTESIYSIETSNSIVHCLRCAKHERARDVKICQKCEGELIFDYKKLEIRRRAVPKVAFGTNMKEPEESPSSSQERLPILVTSANASSDVTALEGPISTDDYITSCMLAASTSAVYRQPVPEGSSIFDSLRSELLPERHDDSLQIANTLRDRSNSMPYGFRWKGFQVIQPKSETTINV